MADPQQEAANREALLRRLLGGGELTPPAPIAPVASHPARDAVLLESRRTPKRRSYAQTERAKINETPEISLGEMRGIENDWYPGMEGRMTRSQMERQIELAMAFMGGGGAAGTLDDVAARMGKPLGAFKSRVVQDAPGGDFSIIVDDVSDPARLPKQAGWIDLGMKTIDDHPVVDMVRVNEPYRDKGMGRELYQEAIEEAKRQGYRGIASDPNTRNKFSNRIWDRPGVRESKSDSDYQVMSEYRPRPGEPPPSPPSIPEPPSAPLRFEPLQATASPLSRGPVASHQPTGWRAPGADPTSEVPPYQASLERLNRAIANIRPRSGVTLPEASHPARSEVMLESRRSPVQRVPDQKAIDYREQWDRQQRDAALNEGRNINDAITPLTREQQLISDSYKQMQKAENDYSAWFSSQENKLPEGQFFKPPAAIEAAHQAQMQQLKAAHEALVKRLTGGFAKEPLPDIDIVPSHRVK